MPTPSSFLHEQITRWTQRGIDLRKEMTFQKELLESSAVALSGSRLATDEQRRRDRRELQDRVTRSRQPLTDQQEYFKRQPERLHALKTRIGDVEEILLSTDWLRNAQSHCESFARRLDLQAQILQEEHHRFHSKLEDWSAQLHDRLTRLQEFKEKEIAKGERVYVSRARKQPDIDFIQEHRGVEETLRSELQQLRKSLNHCLSRIHKMSWTLSERIPDDLGGLVELRTRLEETLGQLESVFYDRRDEILSDALLFEAGRRHLQLADDVVRSMHCVEDSTPNLKSAWAKFLN